MAWSDKDTEVELAARHHEAVRLLAEAVADRREQAEQLERLRVRVRELESEAQTLRKGQRRRLFGLFRRGS